MKVTTKSFFEAPEASSSMEVQEVISTPDGDTTLRVLHILKKAREDKKLSLRKVSDDLRIHLHYLEAIENHDQKEMPERVYTLGFVKSYAKYLELDVDMILTQFKKEILGEAMQKELILPTPIQEKSAPHNLIIILSILTCIGLMIGWYFFS